MGKPEVVPGPSVKLTLLAAVGLVLVMILSGCAAGPTPPNEVSPSPSAAAPPGDFDDATGAVRGVVTTVELQPIVGAQVALKDAEFSSRTAQDGSFSFSRVPPADYVLLVSALGYVSGGKQITVAAGQETSGVNVQLANIPIVEPRMELFVFEGYITCTVGAFGVLSEECGQGAQTPLGTYGTNPSNKIDWKWTYSADQTDLVGTLLEMNWQPGSAAATQLTLYVANKFTCIPECDAAGPVYCGTDNHGPPVQRCRIDKLKMKDTEMPWEMTARAWGAPVEATEVPNVVLEQKFTMFRTDFYGVMGDEGYTAIPDA